MNQKISLQNKIDLQINSNYRGPSKNVQSAREGIFSVNIAMSKDLFKERASLNLNINDVFNSRKRKQTTFTNKQQQDTSGSRGVQARPSRLVGWACFSPHCRKFDCFF